MKNQKYDSILKKVTTRSFLILAATLLISTKSVAQIPDVPFIAANSVDPNIMFVLDDSGSMQFEIMPDEYIFWGVNGNPFQWDKIAGFNGGACDNWNQCDYYYRNSGYVLFTFPRVENVMGNGNNYGAFFSSVASVRGLNRSQGWWTPYEALTRSAQVNTAFYDPGITYSPWSRADGSIYPNASVTCALHHPERANLGCRVLNNNITVRERWADCQQNSSQTGNCTRTFDTRTFWPATYFYKADATSNIWNANSYTRTFIESNTTNYNGQGRENRTDCVNATSASASCTYNEEIQNFANWYTYYRTRMHASQAGIGAAFSDLRTNLRVGYGTLNSPFTNVDGVSTRTVIQGVRQFTQTGKEGFLQRLYNQQVPAMGTPLRRALDDAGRYFSRRDARGPWSSFPGTTNEAAIDNLACRLSYTILMTDGYWNGDPAVVATGNVDNTLGPNIRKLDGTNYRVPASNPFRDGHSNTLADVARYYWNRDLRTDLKNNVPSSSANPAFWQHMVTFGIGLGVTGSVDPNVAFDAVRDGVAIPGGWPNPIPDSSFPAKIDDLLHSAVNSYGGFFSAADPNTFRAELIDTLQQIVARSASGGAVAVSSGKVQPNGSTFAFATNFDSEDWSGDLLAYRITETGVQQTPVWKASDSIPDNHELRNIYMGETSVSGQVPVEFYRDNLTPEQRVQLEPIQGVVWYLRGHQQRERLQEILDGRPVDDRLGFRDRDSVLGSIIHSSPTHSAEVSTVFVGSSDGFLHAFDATTGQERFAFLPAGVNLTQLRTLADPNYTHRYAVDGDILVTTKAQTSGKNILVGALGRGGAGLYALDVTDPNQPKYLWEINNIDSDMGKILDPIVFVTLADGTAAIMVGNGFESASGTAALYIMDILTGEIIEKITTTGSIADANGLSSPVVFYDSAAQHIHAYAGDLHGNVWKFDLSNNDSNAWGVAYGTPSAPLPLFRAVDATGKRQPITAPLTVAVNNAFEYPHTGKRFVWFGTGSYYKQGDPDNRDIQSWYGIIDEGTPVSRSELNAGGIKTEDTDKGYDVRIFNQVNNADVEMKKGWYIDFNAVGSEGERIVTRSNLYFLAQPVLLASSIIPTTDPCEPGGSGYINAINPFTGGNVTNPIFIAEEDFLTVDEGLEKRYAGSVRLNVGMPGEAVIVSDQLIVSGSDAGVDSIKLNLGGEPENKRILWMELIRLENNI